MKYNHDREVQDFPKQFERMAKLERLANHSCIKGDFLDELEPTKGRSAPPIVPNCGTFCEIEFENIIDKRVEAIKSGLKTMAQLCLF